MAGRERQQKEKVGDEGREPLIGREAQLKELGSEVQDLHFALRVRSKPAARQTECCGFEVSFRNSVR